MLPAPLTGFLRRYGLVLVMIAAIPTYILIAGTTGACPACSSVTSAIGLTGDSCPVKARAVSGTQDQTPASPPTVPDRAQDTQPLATGAKAPDAALRNLAGDEVALSTLWDAKPSVLIFYRGGWCPYCNTHLGKLATIDKQLNEMGFQIVAVSPDQPKVLREASEKREFSYALYADSSMAVSRAFGLAFTVDDATLAKYREYGIDLEAASGEKHHQLPVPAVYIVDRTGVIRFAHADADYKVRLDPDAVLAAAKKVLQATASE